MLSVSLKSVCSTISIKSLLVLMTNNSHSFFSKKKGTSIWQSVHFKTFKLHFLMIYCMIYVVSQNYPYFHSAIQKIIIIFLFYTDMPRKMIFLSWITPHYRDVVLFKVFLILSVNHMKWKVKTKIVKIIIKWKVSYSLFN